jgi:hypothetical protein
MKRKRNANLPEQAAPAEAVDMVLRPAPSKDVVEDKEPKATTQSSIHDKTSKTRLASTMAPRLEVDSDDDSEESLLPMLSSRADIRNHRMQELFSQHGAQFGPQYRDLSSSRPPTKIRRVEKAIRIRIHWTCHQCDAQFGREQACGQCGHRKCKECPRQPSKQVRALMGSARQRMEQEQGLSSSDEDAVTPASNFSSPAALFSSQPLESDLSMSDETDDNPFEFSFYGRPRNAVRTSYRSSRTQPTTLRMCHECEAPLSPDSGNCLNCNHVRCEKCPEPAAMSSNPATAWIAARRTMGRRSLSADEVPTVNAVRRVYRKPRQRVRYNCEHCETMFGEGDQCRECGHDRCQDCRREP